MAPGRRRVETSRFIASVGAREAVLVALRCRADEVPDLLAEVDGETGGLPLVVSTDRGDLVPALRANGFHDPAPPIAPTCTALAIEHEPPRVEGVEVRKVETVEESLIALELDLRAFAYPPDVAERRRAGARESFERGHRRPGGQWLAYLDGRAVGYGSAVAGPDGLYLAGGATDPDARGRGAYRALVHARWLAAVERGTPALVVHAQETSRPVLERLGFDVVCTIHELERRAC